jgi:hypothetical protein
MEKKTIKRKTVKKDRKIKENDFTTSKEFMEALDKMIKTKPIVREDKGKK